MIRRPTNANAWLLAMPLAVLMLVIWALAFQLYSHVPHVEDAYATIYAGSRRHQPENTFWFLAVFPLMASLLAGVFLLFVRKSWSDADGKGAGPLVGTAMVMVVFIVASFVRFYSVRIFYGI